MAEVPRQEVSSSADLCAAAGAVAVCRSAGCGLGCGCGLPLLLLLPFPGLSVESGAGLCVLRDGCGGWRSVHAPSARRARDSARRASGRRHPQGLAQSHSTETGRAIASRAEAAFMLLYVKASAVWCITRVYCVPRLQWRLCVALVGVEAVVSAEEAMRDHGGMRAQHRPASVEGRQRRGSTDNRRAGR